jgi:Domain of unknown function (DUF4351)/Putative transposase, YhgA-like
LAKRKKQTTENIGHDELFKTLISRYFLPFLELFLPSVAAMVEPDKLVQLDKELFRGKKKKIADLVVKAQYKGKETFFLILIESQSRKESDFSRRMFLYFARLHDLYDLPVYPIALLTYDSPKTKAQNSYKLVFPNQKQFLDFRYEAIQLNRLKWRDYKEIANPVAGALLPKMQVKKEERRRAKLESYKTLFKVETDEAKLEFLVGFVNTYLTLDEGEAELFEEELKEAVGEEVVMEVMSDWKKEGIELGKSQGIELGKSQGKLEVILQILTQKLGKISPSLDSQLQKLSHEQISLLVKDLLKLNTEAELEEWLVEHGK